MIDAQAVGTAVGSESRRGVFPVAQPLASEGIDIAAGMVSLRRLHFFRDLLRLGFEGTIWPDRASRTLRSERLALGIDLPELDLVALWATRCGDGRVSIPFIEYLLARVRDNAARFLPVDRDRAVAFRLALLDEAIAAIPAGGAPGSDLPSLDEVFISESEAVRLFGLGGVVDLLLRVCEERCLSVSGLS